MPWSGSCVDESETSALPHADLQRAGFHAGQEKKGISNEVMQLVNTKKKKTQRKNQKVLILSLISRVNSALLHMFCA